jgi:LmbE family N-acetylglucosaminyl deacetylase
MKHELLLPTRKDFLFTCAGAALLPKAAMSQTGSRKILIVVAHPDDEYAFAATTYRLVRELGWTADQVVITNGEAGYRYSTLAEVFYGVALSSEVEGRAHLPAVRKEEARRAGKALGIRRLYFLDQKDLGFATDAAAADSSNWDRPRIRSFLDGLMAREQYDLVFTLLPTAQTHGHHRAATLLALDSVAALPSTRRPLVFGAEARGKKDPAIEFAGLRSFPLTSTASPGPALVFDRTTAFGYRNSLDYRIVVNWVIAEHKSQGLFQMDYGKHELEEFWPFEISGHDAKRRVEELQGELMASVAHTAAR